MRQSSDSPWEEIHYTAHRGKTMTSSNKTAFEETKHNKTRYNRDSHYKNSVYWFNKFTSQMLWMTGVIPHMEGTLGDAVSRYLCTILWKDYKVSTFKS